MKDLNLSRVINVVAASGLVLTTAGCGGGARGTARQVCKAMQECDKSDFEEEFSSMKDCIDTYEEYLEDIEDIVDDDDCNKDFLRYSRCGAKAYRKDCDEDDAERECEDELDDLVDSCEDVAFYTYDYYSYY